MSVKAKADFSLTLPADLSGGRLEEFEAEFSSLLSQAVANLCVSCGELEHITSAHVGLLWRITKAGEAKGCRIQLSDVAGGFWRVLETLDLAELFGPLEGADGNPAQMQEPREAPDADRFHLVVTRENFPSSLTRYGQVLRDWSMSARLIFELQSIYYEVVQNILSHAGLADKDEIRVQGQFVCGLLTLTFVDRGIPFDPTQAEVQTDLRAAARQRQSRGLGIVMIRKLTDHLEYSRVGDRNMLFIEKKVR